MWICLRWSHVTTCLFIYCLMSTLHVNTMSKAFNILSIHTTGIGKEVTCMVGQWSGCCKEYATYVLRNNTNKIL